MKKAHSRFISRHKKLRNLLIGLTIFLLILALIIRFLPPTLINIPFGKGFLQLKIQQGFHLFVPKDQNSMYYANNSFVPQVITGVDTSYQNVQGLPYFQMWLPNKYLAFPNPLPTTESYTNPTPNNEYLPVRSPYPGQFDGYPGNTPYPTPYSTSSYQFRSKYYPITFTIPSAYEIEYRGRTDGVNEIININYGPPYERNWISVQLFTPTSCPIPPIPNRFNPEKTVQVGGNWPLQITKSHGKYGSRDQQGSVCLGDNLAITMYRYVLENENQAEKDFDKILETAQISN